MKGHFRMPVPNGSWIYLCPMVLPSPARDCKYKMEESGMEEKRKFKQNLLTRGLLAAGYTVDNHPDYVVLKDGYGTRKSLDNYHGGFTFERKWIREQTFRTPCGLLCKGQQCQSSLSCRGIDWTFENDMATVCCPYEKPECGLRHEYLQRNPAICFWCEVHMTAEEYRYEGSVEELQKIHEKEIREKETQFSLQRGGRVCREHMTFDRDTQEWQMHYDPYRCGQIRCGGLCPVLGHELDKKKGNVFYDLKIRRQRTDLDGTLFEGQVDTSITRGRKLFPHPVSMDICRACVKLCRDRIERDVGLEYSHQLFNAEYYGKEFSVEVLNVRAERRESRDLMQDLEDIRNGIQVVHASDMQKLEAQAKKERRKKTHEAAVKRLEKKLLKEGYGSLEEFSLDRRHADRWLGEERIAQLERQRQESERRERHVQISLSDLEGKGEEGRDM